MCMALIVQKFGGSSVKDAERINNVADIVTSTYKKGNDVVVVVSAQGDTTDDLIAKAGEINEKPSKREMDMLLSAGEQISAALLAMAIERMGYPVVSLLGWQAGFDTSSDYGNARIKRVNTQRIEQELENCGGDWFPGRQPLWGYDHPGPWRIRYQCGGNCRIHACGSVPDLYRCGRRVHSGSQEDSRCSEAQIHLLR